jgi:SSS family solute:Na+ symporter
MSTGLAMLYAIPNPATHHAHFGGSAFSLADIGLPDVTIYAGFAALIVNLVVSSLGTLVARAASIPQGPDATSASDYFADEGDPRVG